GNKANFQPLGGGKNLRPIKDRVVQRDGKDGETEPSRSSQEFVRRIIELVLGIVEGVNVEIELDPIVGVFLSHARAHARCGFRLRQQKFQIAIFTRLKISAEQS